MPAMQKEEHKVDRIGWLRAAVLGANDGILSTASLVLGVATSHAAHSSVLVAGVAGLVAGAMSMAAGEYVSVHSQADTERADLDLERKELKTDNKGEHRELAAIYEARGLDAKLAKQVAEQLMAKDALGAHARDELGLSKSMNARPFQAAWSSAASFAVGASLPLLVTVFAPVSILIPLIFGTALVFLALLGALAARTGGAGVMMGALRVTFWGALAMGVTAGVGSVVRNSGVAEIDAPERVVMIPPGAVRGKWDDCVLWYPTLAAKNASRMGHPARWSYPALPAMKLLFRWCARLLAPTV